MSETDVRESGTEEAPTASDDAGSLALRTREFLPLNWEQWPEYGMARDVWLDARRKGIGSSDVAAILGMDRFNSPMSVYLDKLGEGVEEPENEAMHFGKRLEGVVAAEFAEKNDVETTRPGFMYQHAELDFPLASPDRFVTIGDGLRVLEIKTGRNTDIWEDGPPSSYVIQVTHQLEVTGLNVGHIAVLLNGRDFREYVIPRDEVLAEMLMEREAAFWSLVQQHVPPDVDGHEATTSALKQLYQRVTPEKQIDVSHAWDALVRYRETRERLKVVKENHELAANELRAALGDAEVGLVDGDVVVTWKQMTGGKGRVNLERMEIDHPALVQQYREPVLGRTLRIK